jgi:hypothetical protein
VFFWWKRTSESVSLLHYSLGFSKAWLCGQQTLSFYRLRLQNPERKTFPVSENYSGTVVNGTKPPNSFPVYAGMGKSGKNKVHILECSGNTYLNIVLYLKREAGPESEMSACLLFAFYFLLNSFIFHIWWIRKTFDICPNTKCTLDFITYVLANSSYAWEHFLWKLEDLRGLNPRPPEWGSWVCLVKILAITTG